MKRMDGIIDGIEAAATSLICAECNRRSPGEADGWEGHLVDGEGESDLQEEVAFFCRECVEREFPRNEE
jgi:hypothetical protein